MSARRKEPADGVREAGILRRKGTWLMDVLLISRLQFAAAALFHFLFVPLTLGLSILVAIMETLWVRAGDEQYRRMARFWGRLFVINFALGVVTGITLEFQFGTNWSRYSAYVGDVFGSLLAIEATLAFFLESTFLGVWIFGWRVLSPRLHALSIWIVAAASNLSAYWILTANAWMQHPVGFAIRNGRAELTSLFEVLAQRTAILSFLHTVGGAYTLAGFFVMGISAWHLLRGNERSFFTKSFRMGLAFALIFSIWELALGHLSGMEVAKTQPAKLAAMESFWESKAGAPLALLAFPDEKNERNCFEFGEMPPLLSVLAYGRADAEVKGLQDFPRDERPPVAPTYLAFRVMFGLGLVFIALTAVGWIWRRNLEARPRYLRLMTWSIPLPYIALQAGWIVTEIGRQPWIVYGLMRTSEAVSPITTTQAGTSLAAFVLVYTILGIADFYLLAKYARRGPGPASRTLSAPPAVADKARA